MKDLLLDIVSPRCEMHEDRMQPSPGYPFDHICKKCIKSLGDDLGDFLEKLAAGSLNTFEENL